MQLPFVSRASYDAEVAAHEATVKLLNEAKDLIAKQAQDLITVREACANRVREANSATERLTVENASLRLQLRPFKAPRRRDAKGWFLPENQEQAA